MYYLSAKFFLNFLSDNENSTKTLEARNITCNDILRGHVMQNSSIEDIVNVRADCMLKVKKEPCLIQFVKE